MKRADKERYRAEQHSTTEQSRTEQNREKSAEKSRKEQNTAEQSTTQQTHHSIAGMDEERASQTPGQRLSFILHTHTHTHAHRQSVRQCERIGRQRSDGCRSCSCNVKAIFTFFLEIREKELFLVVAMLFLLSFWSRDEE